MFIAPLEQDSKYVHSGIANNCMLKRPQIQLCAPLAIRFRIANRCTRWRRNFKGLSQNGGQADCSKNLRASLSNDDLSNEPKFGRIHLAGQYLESNIPRLHSLLGIIALLLLVSVHHTCHLHYHTYYLS
jgi:hypothetical protein